MYMIPVTITSGQDHTLVSDGHIVLSPSKDLRTRLINTSLYSCEFHLELGTTLSVPTHQAQETINKCLKENGKRLNKPKIFTEF